MKAKGAQTTREFTRKWKQKLENGVTKNKI
jgi:hypothetical protein